MLLPEHPPAFVSIGQLKCKQEKKMVQCCSCFDLNMRFIKIIRIKSMITLPLSAVFCFAF